MEDGSGKRKYKIKTEHVATDYVTQDIRPRTNRAPKSPYMDTVCHIDIRVK